ncbi:Isoprenylcysteine carboxyl methyltransferase (ICMT) family protein [compost metagenome]|uniref:isoprenylcysteine carboxylmethyltransferase family protein n=1 Tax=Paenibacillus sp. J53TS2 TaxID=2807197 RepID=UPI000FA90279|nr:MULTISPECIES: isoprenylcysteine carboxylmethyltransferase family protein [Paenibacillus]MUG84964.1 DUF1295 domain-containing protein [Paenibacillus timonensis]GIP47766.1 isoprenylcysteine carboxyl methyltransferase [Paenibacillus sp. J53TS2]
MVTGMILIVLTLLRIPSAIISGRNEARIKAHGGLEYGKTNSRALIVVQFLIYLGTMGYAFIEEVPIGTHTYIGLAVYVFAMAVLVYVIRTLGRFWTFKIYIAKGHQLVETPLFKRIKHPNYYLNIIPEVLSFAIISQAWIVFTPLFILHLITLFNRIRLEEKIMKQTFREYGKG